MTEVKRYHLTETGLVEGESLGRLSVVLADAFDRVTAERDAALGREAALREELEMAGDDLVIFKGAVSALGEVSKKLVFCARTSGGTAGPDQGLMDACAGVEGVITLGGIARAMNEFERLTSERDDLASRLEQARDRKNSIVDLQQRLTAADERVDLLEGLLREVVSLDPRGELLGWQLDGKIDAALKPAQPAKDERICPGCGTKGYTACCTQCVPY